MILLLLALTINPNNSLLKGAQVGVCFYDIEGDSFLYHYNWNKNFIPASNLKIFTTAAALFLLNPEYRFKTKFGLDRYNNLYILSSGDPTLTRKDFLAKLKEIFKRRKDKISDIIIEPRAIHGIRYPWGWSWHYLDAAYAPRMSGLILDGNTFELKLKPGVQVDDSIDYSFCPELEDIEIDNQAHTMEADSGWHVNLYRELGLNHVHIYGGIGIDYPERVVPISLINPLESHKHLIADMISDKHRIIILKKEDTLSAQVKVIDSLVSLPLIHILKKMNFESENLYAEAIAHALCPADTMPNTLYSGIDQMESLFARLGIDTSRIAIFDGSGLSRFNRITPYTMIKLLAKLYHSRYRNQFISVLPYGGEGTLWYRFKEEGEKIRCKTGTIYGVSCLSGYILNDGQPIAFAIMVNDYLGSRRALERWQDSICHQFIEQ